MKTSTKALAATMLLLASTSAYAGFEVTNRGIAVSMSSASNFIQGEAMILEISKVTNKTFISYSTIVRNINSSNCSEGNVVIAVNGVNVQFVVKPHGLQCSYSPKTQAGMDYLIDEFTTKNVVKVGNIPFSAAGFNNALKTLQSQSNAI